MKEPKINYVTEIDGYPVSDKHLKAFQMLTEGHTLKSVAIELNCTTSGVFSFIKTWRWRLNYNSTTQMLCDLIRKNIL